MEENLNLKVIDQSLKKYISKSIYRKELAECDTLMSRQDLNLFYNQMQEHFYQEKVKKLKRERRLSLGNDKILFLEDKKPIKMNIPPEFLKKNKEFKTETTYEKNNKTDMNFWIKDSKKANIESEEIENRDEINYFVRKVKNPKVIRYISLKPSLEEIKKSTAFKIPKESKTLKSNKKLINSNFMERTILFDKIKKNINQINRNSCLEF